MKKLYTLGFSFLFFISIAHTQIIFEDNFDSYTIGNMLDQNPDVWGVWSGLNNANENIIVTDLYANSGTQSGFIDAGAGPQDVILNLGNQTTGAYELNFNMFIPANKTAYFNIQGLISPTGGAGGGGNGVFNSPNLVFNNTASADGMPGRGGAYPNVDSAVPDYFWEYPEDTWFPIRILFLPDSSTWKMTVNNIALETQDMDADQVVGGIDFYAIDANNEYYVDDFVFQIPDLTAVELTEANILSAYPNPVLDEFVILTEDKVDQVDIYSIIGQKVISISPNVISPRINLAGLQSGSYFVKIKIGDSFKTIKITK